MAESAAGTGWRVLRFLDSAGPAYVGVLEKGDRAGEGERHGSAARSMGVSAANLAEAEAMAPDRGHFFRLHGMLQL